MVVRYNISDWNVTANKFIALSTATATGNVPIASQTKGGELFQSIHSSYFFKLANNVGIGTKIKNFSAILTVT